MVASMRWPAEDTELSVLDERRMLVIRLDLQDYNTIQPAISAAIARFSTIDVLLNSAGFSWQNGLLFETISHHAQFSINHFGNVHFCLVYILSYSRLSQGVMDMIRAIVPHFRRNKRGGIINVVGAPGPRLPSISLHTAAKYALDGFTEAVSCELASQNIFIKTVMPDGNTSTGFLHPAAGTQRHPATVIAEIIYKAATDGKSQLRYIGGDASS